MTTTDDNAPEPEVAADKEAASEREGASELEAAPDQDTESEHDEWFSRGADSEQDAKEQTSSGNVSVVQHEGRTIHIIGTAHVSRKSVDEVREVIARLEPDTVCLELCQMRYEALTDESRWKKLDIFQVIKDGKVLYLMASLALQSFQRRLGEKLGVKPGSELLAGAEAAKEVGAELVLVDRNVQATLRRTWANVGFFNKLKLVGGLMASVFDADEEIDEEQVEALKDRDNISDMMGEFARVMPEVKEPLIDERDRFLMSAIEEAPGETIVAVVGAGHVEGMLAHRGKTVDRDELAKMPPPSTAVRIAKWVVPMIILAAFSYGYFKHQGEGLMYMLFAWVIPNAVVAGLFTLLAGGKLLTALTALFASPITSLNPTIGAGMFAGLVEAYLRKPTVEDCEQLGTEVNTLKGAFKNPVSRILIVALAASIGSSLGAWVGAAWVVKIIATG